MTAKPLQLDTSVQYVKGIGPKRAELLKKVDVETIEDLLTYYPRRYLDRSRLTQIRSLKTGDDVTVVGKVFSCESRRGRTQRFIVVIGDGTGFLHCVWFRGLQYISKVFNVGDTVAFSGKVTTYRGPQLVHPEYDKISEEGESDPLHTGGIIPLYPSTEYLSRIGLDGRGFRKVIRQALNGASSSIYETLPEGMLESLQLLSRKQALEGIHFPKNQSELEIATRRLKFEELFFIQLFLAFERFKRQEEQKGIAFEVVGYLTNNLMESLPFELTEAQKNVLRDIRRDMKADRAMNRLLQGDVGSGKTVVALVAMLIAVENGYQTALMAPTEILAEQHFLTIHDFLESLGVRIVLFKGSKRAAEKRENLEKLAAGEIDIAVGTHALVQKDVNFKNLGFVVIDEQHRFGVMQRATLRGLGMHPDVLVMTATPIPRTLALTLYGDLDVSILNELPKGRQPIRTVWRRAEKKREIYSFIKGEVAKGRQVYIVYPLVEESEKMDLAAATEGYETLVGSVFSDLKVALLHGRMKSDEKENVMEQFKAGEIDILVSTTVVEVGVDVPNATVMLVEHAERFGLTQLHQLRGRVGRGSEASTCILLTHGYISDDAHQRMQTMTDTQDGFKIAEADLQMRGPGELYGTRQHGMLRLKIADLTTDGQILQKAREEAFRIVEEDPRLESEDHRGMKKAYLGQYKDRFGLMQVG